MKMYLLCIIICSVGLMRFQKANAGQVQAGQAPLIYEYNLKGPFTGESELISTSGTIKTINASWEFEGVANLEVSANGGLAYTKIINGQSLSEGFIPGNQLCFRINLASNTILKKIIIGYTDTSNADTTYRNPVLKSFKFQKSIFISGGNRQLFNYPVKIKVGFLNTGDISCDGNIESDFRDARFTSADGQSILPYYLEELQGKDKQYSLFWVKIPQLPTEGVRIYFYYGNKEAVCASLPESVFSLFDDFNALVLDNRIWQVRSELKKGCVIKNGYLELTDCSIVSHKFKMEEQILEFKAKAEKNGAIQAIVRGNDTNHSLLPFEETVYSSSYPGAEHTIAVNDVAKLNINRPIKEMRDYIYKVKLKQAGITFERYSEDYEKEAEVRFLDTFRVDEGYIGLKASSAPFGNGSVYFDWVRARPYTEVEPKVFGEN